MWAINGYPQMKKTQRKLLAICCQLTVFCLPVGLVACVTAPQTTVKKTTGDLQYQLPVGLAANPQVQWGKNPEKAWWHAYGSREIDQEVAIALKNNPGLEEQAWALRQQYEQYLSSRGSLLFPQVSASSSANREKLFFGPGLLLGPFNLYNAGVNVSYGIDLFGASRYALQSALSRIDSQRYQYAAASQTLVANVITASFNRAYAQVQLQTTENLLHEQQDYLHLLQQQQQAGAVSDDQVADQQAVLLGTAAVLPGLKKAEVQALHQLNLLLGRSPDTPTENLSLQALQIPQGIPVSVPSQLLQQRPDLRATEALWQAAAADVGVAKANLYPQIRLTANYASTAVSPSQLFSAKSMVWGLGGGITAPIFDGGALRAEKRAAIDAFNAAGVSYRQTVLRAFQDVADSLQALQQDAEAEQLRLQALQAAQHSLQLSQARYQAGAEALTRVLLQQQTVTTAEQSLVTAHSMHLADSVALYQAIGGQWGSS